MKYDSLYWVGVQRGFISKGSLDLHASACRVFVRGDVGGFSDKSRQRLLFYLRNSVATFRVFATLTYPKDAGTDGKKCKRELKLFLQRLRRNQTIEPGSTDRRSISAWSAVWFQEWQQNGRLHFHLFCTHYVDKHWLSKCWADVVRSTDPAHLKAGTNVKGIKDSREQMCRYAGKYAIKADQKDVPKGWTWPGRFWGVAGCRSVVAAATSYKSTELRSPELYNAVMTLDRAIKSDIAGGSLTPVQPNDGCSIDRLIFTYENPEVGSRLLALVSIVESLRICVRDFPVFAFEHEARREAKHQAELAML